MITGNLETTSVRWSSTGPHEDQLEVRVAKIEADVAHIRSDLHDVKDDLKELRGDVKDFRGEMRGEMKELRNDAHSDFRLLFGALVGVTLGLASLMARGFGWL